MEAGFDKQKGSTQAAHSSALYNETALLLCLQHTSSYITQPHSAKGFEKVIASHYAAKEVQDFFKKVGQLAYVWEKEKKKRLDMALAQDEETDKSILTAAVVSENHQPQQESKTDLDEKELQETMALLSIKWGGSALTVASSSKAEEKPKEESTSSSSSSSSSVSAAEYHPSLGFVCMLARASKNIEAAFEKLNNAVNKSS